MLLTKQVIHSLHGIECADWHLNEDCVPVAHCAIPKTWKFESLEFLAVLALRRDEACLLVDILRKVEAIALVVLCSTNKVNWVEVCAFLEHAYILLVVCINLARLKNLRTNSSVVVVAEERTATRLAYILHYTTNADRSIELSLEVFSQFGICQFCSASLLAAQCCLNET